MLIKFLSKIISSFKGDNYSLDKEISSRYLLSLILTRSVMVLKGQLFGVKHEGLLFIGKNTLLKARYKMVFGRSVTLDDNCLIDALSINGVSLGNNVSLGKRSVIECTGSLKNLGKGIIVEDNVGLGRDCFYGCAGGIVIKRDTIIGNFVSFHSENHISSDLTTPIRLQGVTHKGIEVGENCWIGAKATILDGAQIGNGCIIAAGTVVTAGKYTDNGIYGGVPAKLIKFRS